RQTSTMPTLFCRCTSSDQHFVVYVKVRLGCQLTHPICSERVRYPALKSCLKRIADITKGRELFFVGASDRRRIRKTPVYTLCWPRKEQAGFSRIVTHRNDIVEGLRKEFAEVFGAIARDINSTFGHRLNCQRVHHGRFRTCAVYLHLVASQR